MLRVLQAIARDEDDEHALVLWDISGFYEHIDAEAIEKAVTQDQLPLVPTAVALIGHAGSRISRWQRAFTEPVTPRRSIGTGCHTSPSFARAIMKRNTDKSTTATQTWRRRRMQEGATARDAPEVRMLVHVDDFSQEATGSRTGVTEALREAGEAFIDETEAAGLTISSKSLIVASCKGVARRLRAAFISKGIVVQIAAAGEHLGVWRSSPRGRTFVGLKSRFKKARKRHS